MDDTAQQNQPVVDGSSKKSQSQPQQPVVPSAVAPTKEHAPLVTHNEYIKPAPHEAAVEIPAEVTTHIEAAANNEQPKLTEEHRKLGIQEAGVAMPAPTSLSDDQSFPLTKAQIDDSRSKQYTVWDQFKWFGAVVGRQMLRAHKKLFR